MAITVWTEKERSPASNTYWVSMSARHRASIQRHSERQDRLHHWLSRIYILMMAKRNTNEYNGHGKRHARDKLGDVTENRVGKDILGGLKEVSLGIFMLEPELWKWG